MNYIVCINNLTLISSMYALCFQISSLQIRSPYPSYAIINEWHNISTDLGLAHIEFQLAPDTPEVNRYFSLKYVYLLKISLTTIYYNNRVTGPLPLMIYTEDLKLKSTYYLDFKQQQMDRTIYITDLKAYPIGFVEHILMVEMLKELHY